MATEVVMPQMGESIAEGTITKWLKNVGDHIERDEPLFEISTDKVDAEIPSPAAGTLTEIKFKEGETVEVDTVVAVLDGASAQPAAETAAAKEQETPAETEALVSAAQPIEPEPAEPQPVVAQAPEPPAIPPSAPAPPAAAASHKTEVKPLHRRTDAAPVSRSQDNGSATAEELRRTKSSPLVRKIAEEHGIDIKQLEGTGMSGRVTKNDILSYIESGSIPERTAAPAAAPKTAPQTFEPQPLPASKPATGDRIEQMSVMRRKIAEHMILSRRTSAHVTTVYEIDMSKVAKLREENRKSFEDRTGTKLTFMPFIIKAVIEAIKKSALNDCMTRFIRSAVIRSYTNAT